MSVSANRFSGSLIGQCLGDALGFPFEGRSTSHCAAYVQQVLRERSSPLPARFGQYTDDSQLARELLQSYAALGHFDPADYAQRIAAIFRENRIVGRGRATHEAAQRLIAGVPWTVSGTPAPSAGNGSSMRAGPIGLLFYDDAEALLRAAQDQSRITHLDRRCAAGAVAIAGAVSLALCERFDLAAWSAQLRDQVATFDTVLVDGIARLESLLRLPLSEAAQIIRNFGQRADYDNGWEGVSPFVTGSVLWSVYAFCRSPDDYWETICTAIAVGGDVDTTAAMAGAISGAYAGVEALPRELTAQLNDQGTWRLEELVGLADECYAIKQGEKR